MKKLLLLLPLLACTAPNWQTFAIDQRVSVQLPAQPAEVNFDKLAYGRQPADTRVWLLRAPEGIYQIMRLPTSISVGAHDEARRNAFYEGAMNSLLRTDQGKLVAITAFPTNAGTSVEYEYKGLSKITGRRVLKFVRWLVVDSVAYSLNFMPTDKQDSLGLAGAEQRRHFYNSLIVK